MINRHHRRYNKMDLQRLIEDSDFAVRAASVFFCLAIGVDVLA